MSSVLILTSGPLCRNPRVLKEALTLGQAGFATTVMTIARLPELEACDSEILRGAPFKKVALDLISRDWDLRIRAETNRFATWLARHATRWGLESRQTLGPARSLYKMASRFQADLTIVHTELPFCIGARLLEHGRRVAADFEDWHSQDLLPEAQKTRPQKLISRVEKILLRHAVYTSTTSHVMAEALHDFGNGTKVPVVITNAFPLQSVTASKPLSDYPGFFWFSQTIGPGRGLEQFIEGWRETKQTSRLALLGNISQHYRESLVKLVPTERRSRLSFLPLVSPADLPALIANFDIGLALEPRSPANKNLTISNKVLQYFNAGLGVLASDTLGQREVLQNAPSAGCFLALEQPAHLTQQLDKLLREPDQIRTMGIAARQAAERIYCWEKEAPRLIQTVETALHSPPSISP